MMITARTLPTFDKIPSITFDPLAVESFRFEGQGDEPATIEITTRSGDRFIVLDPEHAVSDAIKEVKDAEIAFFVTGRLPGEEMDDVISAVEGFDV